MAMTTTQQREAQEREIAKLTARVEQLQRIDENSKAKSIHVRMQNRTNLRTAQAELKAAQQQ